MMRVQSLGSTWLNERADLSSDLSKLEVIHTPHTHTLSHRYSHLHIHSHTHTTHTYTYILSHTYAYTHIYSHTYIHTHTHQTFSRIKIIQFIDISYLNMQIFGISLSFDAILKQKGDTLLNNQYSF